MSLENNREARPSLQISSIIRRGCILIYKNFLVLFGILLIGLTPALALGLLAAISYEINALVFSLFVFLTGIAILIYACVAQGGISLVAFKALRAEPVSVMPTVKVVLAHIFPFLGTSLLFGIILLIPGIVAVALYAATESAIFLALGFVALVLICYLYVTLPACIIERLGPTASIKRAIGLSNGYRLGIGGLIVVTLLVSILFNLVLSLGVELFGAIPAIGVLLMFIISFVGSIFIQVLSSIIIAVCYFDLRKFKEGVSVENLTDVF